MICIPSGLHSLLLSVSHTPIPPPILFPCHLFPYFLCSKYQLLPNHTLISTVENREVGKVSNCIQVVTSLALVTPSGIAAKFLVTLMCEV